ncbi:hypothetical protein [Streptomyces sp. NPDC021562]|uniref:hypothetical protein n=1 Tax=Streptomyces sp. NPDC021562 TaxID=3155121 RepID=UPI0033F315BB
MSRPRAAEAVDGCLADCARCPRANGVPVPQTARKPVVTAGRNKVRRPSVATAHRILAADVRAVGECRRGIPLARASPGSV